MALLLTDKLRASLTALEEQTVLPAPQRLMCRLVQMAQGHDQWADRLRTHRELAVSQEQLARMLGLSRQTTNQILQDLQQAGWLQVRRGRLEVLDLPPCATPRPSARLAPRQADGADSSVLFALDSALPASIMSAALHALRRRTHDRKPAGQQPARTITAHAPATQRQPHASSHPYARCQIPGLCPR